MYFRRNRVMETIVLASGSPRRRELLSRLSIPFEVITADVDETCSLGARAAVYELACRKAKAVARLCPGRYILAADTLVSLDDRPLGKPATEADAASMLRRLSGRTHQVHTGVCVISPSGALFADTDTSDVTFAPLSEQAIWDYIATKEPMDKAGAYALQGHAALWIPEIRGSSSGIIGLPLFLTGRLLKEAGYPLEL